MTSHLMPRPSSFAVLLIALLLVPWTSGAENGAGQSLVPPGAPKSAFTDDPAVGKDPFFPKSSRRKFVPKTEDEPLPPEPAVPDFIKLNGISVTDGRRLAIISNYTAAQGEEFTLKHNGQPLKVQCVEIKDKSVIIAVNGVTKELPLRAALQ